MEEQFLLPHVLKPKIFWASIILRMPDKENYPKDLLCQKQDTHKLKCEITAQLMMTG